MKKILIALMTILLAFTVSCAGDTPTPDDNIDTPVEPTYNRKNYTFEVGETFKKDIYGEVWNFKINTSDNSGISDLYNGRNITEEQTKLVHEAFGGNKSGNITSYGVTVTHDAETENNKPYTISFIMTLYTAGEKAHPSIFGRTFTVTRDITGVKVSQESGTPRDLELTPEEEESIRTSATVKSALTNFTGFSMLNREGGKVIFEIDPDMPATNSYYSTKPAYLLSGK